MAKSKMVRVPRELLIELNSIQKADQVVRKCDGFRKIAEYARIGREIAHKDLLNANALWFGIRQRRKKK